MKDYRVNGLAYINDYGGRPEDLRGLSADFATRTIHFPPGLDAGRHDTVQAMVMPAAGAASGRDDPISQAVAGENSRPL